MAYPGLPALYSLEDASIYRHTVVPFLPQFFEVERVFYGEIPAWTYFTTTNPFVLGLHQYIAWTILTLTLSVATGNYSWTDRLWSIIPTSYVTMLVVRAYASGTEPYGLLHTRLLVSWVISILWSVRLTRNYARKGGYHSGSEDYRWQVIRSGMGDPTYLLFQNLVYIPLQNILVASIAVPAYIIFLVGDEVPINWRDVVAVMALLMELYGAHVSDNKQFRYHQAKKHHALRQFETSPSSSTDVTKSRKDSASEEFSRVEVERGFVTSGLWSISRHPAFLLEQAFWTTFYLWSASTTDDYWNYSIVGCIGYFILFQGSTRLTERLTGQKYGEYRRYQRVVGMLVPVPYGRWKEREDRDESQGVESVDSKKKK